MKTMVFLKRTVAGVLSAGATLLISACYGPMYDNFDLAQGNVTVPEGTPDQYGVQVCAEFQGEDRICSSVFQDGNYYITAHNQMLKDQADMNGYRLCAKDQAELFVESCVDVAPGSGFVVQDFNLEFLPEEK